MNTVLIRAQTRGHVQFDWLDTWHTFSFSHYYDPERMGFGALRVINDDTIAPGAGFDEHFHENMEIVTIPLSGTLEHKDSLGNKGQITAGEIQYMSAGHGILHAEYNPSKTEPVSLFQIWIIPEARNLKPAYVQTRIETPANRFTDLKLPLRQKAAFWLGRFDRETETRLDLRPGHGLFVMMIEGEAEAGHEMLGRRDAIGVWNTDAVTIRAKAGASVLVIDIPMLNEAET
ncbi:MAG TPA: pirin family protein [Verrucomicrobiae bacterium]|nr:pirin family protein [Verrucomicrobiae bacterium]